MQTGTERDADSERGGWWERWLKGRDIFLTFFGAGGLGFEALTPHPQTQLVIAFSGLLVTPIFLPGGIRIEIGRGRPKGPPERGDDG